jgi:hypothetical protein
MKREYISGAATWAEADAHFEAFVAGLPERREQLVQRLTETGGPTLDGTLEGLDALNEWYIATALADEPDGMDWLPTWLPISGDFGRGPDGERLISPQVYRLWELVGVYLGDLALARFPDSRWVCWRDPSQGMVFNGEPIIDVGLPRFPLWVLSKANVDVPRTYSYHGTGHRYDVAADPTRLRRVTTTMFEQAAERLHTTPRRWQKAPTGPDAHRRTNTRPF